MGKHRRNVVRLTSISPLSGNGVACLITAVQHERGPRNSTIRRQVAMYLRESSELASAITSSAPFRPPVLPPHMYLGMPPRYFSLRSPNLLFNEALQKIGNSTQQPRANEV